VADKNFQNYFLSSSLLNFISIHLNHFKYLIIVATIIIPTMTHFGSSIRDAQIIKIFLEEKKFQETKDEP